MNTANKRWLDVKEAAEHISVNPQVLRRWVRCGKLSGEGIGKAGRDYRFRTEALDRFLQNGFNKRKN